MDENHINIGDICLVLLNIFVYSRKKIAKKLAQSPENTISPAMWLQLNPAYRLEKNNNVTHFRETFKGKRE